MTRLAQAAGGLRGERGLCEHLMLTVSSAAPMYLPHCGHDSRAQLPARGRSVEFASLRSVCFVKFQLVFIDKESTGSGFLFLPVLVSRWGMGFGGGACYLVWGAHLIAVFFFLPLLHMDSFIRDDSREVCKNCIWLKMNRGFSRIIKCLYFRNVTSNFPSLKSKSHQLFSNVFKYFVQF